MDSHAASDYTRWSSLDSDGGDSPFLVGYLEIAAHRAIQPYCEEREATVGRRIGIDSGIGVRLTAVP